ncbi:MAG TPA: DUF72 domain-containing protein [Candidatus Acidoferrales bacterium]|nr:DUF72 domain-containing protein [Candidatus Acidoferrales bacterium]
MNPSTSIFKRTKEVRVGPAGWSYPDWEGIVYPAHKPKPFHEAEYLSRFFDTIEINTSFYQPLRAPLANQWLEQVAANPKFLFTAKLWQKFTHETNATVEDEAAVRAGFDALREGGRLGAILLQFPFSFHNTAENLAYLKQLLKKFQDYPLVVEVRHASWSGEAGSGKSGAGKALDELLRERRVGFCNIDQPIIGKSLAPSERATSDVGYVRLHGRRYDTWFTDDPKVPVYERYNYLYSEAELQPWAGRVKKVASHAETTFVVTNNHYQGKSIVNALELLRLLRGEKVRVPETLRHHYPRLEAIASEPAAEPTLFPLEPR